MNTYDNQYLDLVEDILANGMNVPCRTGNNVLTCISKQLSFDMSSGKFPILTFRPLPFKGGRTELSAFLHGITDKKYLQDNNCQYWNQWCNPTKIPNGLSDEERKEYQLKERDLGNIYGFHYRHFGYDYDNYDTDYTNKGIDQLKNVVETLKTNPYDRRMIISAWDPAHFETQALPACLWAFTFTYAENKLHMTAEMRSTDTILGLPTDMIYCALFLKIMTQTVNMEPGLVTIHSVNCHIYDNHIDIVKENLERWRKEQYALPILKLNSFATVFNFTPEMAELINYEHGPKVSFPIAV